MCLPVALTKHERRWRRFVAALGLLILLACAFRALTKVTDGDFKLHWEFGRRFLAGTFLYANGHEIPYPPFWAMAHAPAALLSLAAAKTVLFPLGVVALWVLLATLRRLALPAVSPFWVAVLALVFASRFVIRDLAELGVNTELVTLTWLAIYLWTGKRDWLAGVSLGMAVALKCTPAIFVGYFLWKRQWRMVATSALAAAAFTLAPIVWQGPASYSHHVQAWATNAWNGFGSSDPSIGVLGPEPVQNMSLRPALARYLVHLPPGHLGRSDHPLFWDGLGLPPHVAGWIIKAVLFGILLTAMWNSRRSIAARDDPEIHWELAGVSIVMLLFSPITWGQHCVALLPACYFISARLLRGPRLARWMIVLLGIYVLFTVLLSRDLLGRDLALLLASYHMETFSILGLFAVVLGCARQRDTVTT